MSARGLVTEETRSTVTTLHDSLEVTCAVGKCKAVACIDLHLGDSTFPGKTYSITMPRGWVMRATTSRMTVEGNRVFLCAKHAKHLPKVGQRSPQKKTPTKKETKAGRTDGHRLTYEGSGGVGLGLDAFGGTDMPELPPWMP